MPIYDYLCSSCGQKTEVIHGIHAPAPRFCPACGADGTLRKTFATPAVHFKGSGWAKKDRSSSSASRSKVGSTPSSDSAEGANKTADSASDAKSTGTEGATPAKTSTDKD